MTRDELDDVMHELICRDRYLVSSTGVGMQIRDVYPDLPEPEVVAAMWGEHAPPDLTSMLVLEVDGRSDLVMAIPLGEAEAKRWKAGAEAMWAALSSLDDEASAG